MRLAASALRGLLALAPLLALALPAGSAWSAPVTWRERPVIGCVDPWASRLLSHQATVGRHSLRWREAVEHRGRCFLIRAESRWEPIADRGDLVLIRRSPPERGVPPLYVPAAVATRKAAEAPSEPDVGAAPLTAVTEESLSPLAPNRPPPTKPAPKLAAPKLPVRGQPPPPVQPPPVQPPPVQPAPVQAVVARPPAAAVAGSDASPRGYAFGFVLAVLLTTLFLATLALLFRLLLRRAVEPAQPALMRPIELSPRTTLAERRPSPPAMPLPTPPSVRRARVGQVLLPPATAREHPDAQRRCADLLREAGWQVRVGAAAAVLRAGDGLDRGCDPGIDLVARRDGRVLALRCPPRAAIVNEEVVEQACIVRERERADRAAIVSEAPFAAAARKLAMQTGIDLLEPDQLKAFAR